MYMKSSHADDSSKGIPTSARRHIVSRIHKASTYANQLVTLLQDRDGSGAASVDVLEAQAYALCLLGARELEKHASQQYNDAQVQKTAWRSCLVSFSEAHVIYTALLSKSAKDAYREVLAGTVDPSIRYAAYQSRIPRTTAIATIAKQSFRTDQSALLSEIESINPSALTEEQTIKSTTDNAGAITADIPTTVAWRGRTAPIADASIGQALAAATLAATQLSEVFVGASSANATTAALAAAYDAVLTASQDAVDATRRAISELSREGVAESDARMQDLRVTDLYTNHALVSWRIGRNRVLISGRHPGTDGLHFIPDAARTSLRSHANKKPSTKPFVPKPESRGHALARLRDRVVLYDATLQSLDAIAQLRGAARDEGLQAELAARRAYFAALRTLNIGYSHALLGHHPQALALFSRAASVAPQTAPDATTDKTTLPTLSISPTQTSALRTHLTGLVTRQRGLVSLHALYSAASHSHGDGDSNAAVRAAQPPLATRLDDFPAPGESVDLDNVVAWPPRVQPVPVKPIFLDLAWNYIQYPGAGGEERVREGLEAGAGEVMEGVVEGVKELVGSAVEAVVPAASEDRAEEKPKKRGWFGFGRG